MLDLMLNNAEVRVLGCLIEKQLATPEYYPLSLVALTNACNQKSSRNPVVAYDDKTVVRALEELKQKDLARQSNVSRVPKYEETLTGSRNMVAREAAILCLLLLRGPQTIGELRGRSDRLFQFTDLEQVATTLQDMEESGLVLQLPRQPGRKEARYGHLLSGIPAAEPPDEMLARPEPAALEVRAENERIAALEQQVSELRQELADLRQQFVRFKTQFE